MAGGVEVRFSPGQGRAHKTVPGAARAESEPSRWVALVAHVSTDLVPLDIASRDCESTPLTCFSKLGTLDQFLWCIRTRFVIFAKEPSGTKMLGAKYDRPSGRNVLL